MARSVRHFARAISSVSTTPVRAMVMSHAQFRDAIKGSDSLLSIVIAAAADRLRRDSLARS
jgi:CRP-like cAMP-binding protein